MKYLIIACISPTHHERLLISLKLALANIWLAFWFCSKFVGVGRIDILKLLEILAWGDKGLMGGGGISVQFFR